MAKLAIPSVTRMPLEDQAVDALRESIIAGAIPAGTRITEIKISDQMKLSRATVRNALRQLQKEGLLTLVPYTGWAVVSLSSVDVWELYTLRSAIERLATQLVARSLNEASAGPLRLAFDKLVKECQKGTANGIAEADFSLHKTIIELASHKRLLIQYSLLEQQIRVCIRSSDALIPDPELIISQHRPIVDAILAKDVRKSGKLAEEHNLSEGQKLADHLKKQEASPGPHGSRNAQPAGQQHATRGSGRKKGKKNQALSLSRGSR